jgi:hypothetical protein
MGRRWGLGFEEIIHGSHMCIYLLQFLEDTQQQIKCLPNIGLDYVHMVETKDIIMLLFARIVIEFKVE